MSFSLENEHYLKIKQLFASYPHLIASDFEDRIKQSIRVLHFEYLWGACKEAQIIANKNQNLILFDLIMSLYNKRRESHQAKFLLLHCFENALRSTMAVITANAFNQTQDNWFLQSTSDKTQQAIKQKAHNIATHRNLNISNFNTFQVFDLFSMGDLEYILERHYSLFSPLFSQSQIYKGQNLPIYGTKAHLISTIDRIRNARNEIFHNKPTKIKFQKDIEILLLRFGYNLFDATQIIDIQRFIKLKFIYNKESK